MLKPSIISDLCNIICINMNKYEYDINIHLSNVLICYYLDETREAAEWNNK